jgi:hypothetical protein
MSRLSGMMIGAIGGYFVGVVLGMVCYCNLSPNPSNLCGLIGFFYTGPIGLVIGVVSAFFASRPKGQQPGGGG